MNYKVFVHLIADDNAVLAQNDSEPAKGARPTKSWEVGEYLKDEHLVELTDLVKPGFYRLEVGLYDPVSNQRLPVMMYNTEQENQRLILTAIEVN